MEILVQKFNVQLTIDEKELKIYEADGYKKVEKVEKKKPKGGE
jgi:hypothetical protein